MQRSQKRNKSWQDTSICKGSKATVVEARNCFFVHLLGDTFRIPLQMQCFFISKKWESKRSLWTSCKLHLVSNTLSTKQAASGTHKICSLQRWAQENKCHEFGWAWTSCNLQWSNQTTWEWWMILPGPAGLGCETPAPRFKKKTE